MNRGWGSGSTLILFFILLTQMSSCAEQTRQTKALMSISEQLEIMNKSNK